MFFKDEYKYLSNMYGCPVKVTFGYFISNPLSGVL